MSRGVFLAIEGPDGSGKSTQAARLVERLRAQGRHTVLVREPGGTPLGERVRELLLDPALADMDLRAELFLFMACRAQLVAWTIRPALDQDAVVVTDRFLLSTVVYQGMVGGLSVDEVRRAGHLATAGLAPARTVILDVPAELGLRRLGGAPDRMEGKGIEFHRRICTAYREAADQEPGAVRVDGTRPPDAVAQAVWEAVADAL